MSKFIHFQYFGNKGNFGRERNATGLLRNHCIRVCPEIATVSVQWRNSGPDGVQKGCTDGGQFQRDGRKSSQNETLQCSDTSNSCRSQTQSTTMRWNSWINMHAYSKSYLKCPNLFKLRQKELMSWSSNRMDTFTSYYAANKILYFAFLNCALTKIDDKRSIVL